MYKNPTFEELLDACLNEIPSQVDKTEGSILYDAIAPACMELAKFYTQLDDMMDKVFLDTTYETYLTRKAEELGIKRQEASFAVRKGEFNVPVPLGSLFRIEDVTYEVNANLKDLTYELMCQTLGLIGNYYKGDMIPLQGVEGLEKAILSDVLVPGEEEETDETLRRRVKESISNRATDGNINQYHKWANEFEGIGRVKVFPLWKGSNTVKVSVTNSLYQPASTELIEKFQTYLDPGSKGLGNGMAPIGSKVSVVSGNKKDINIQVEVRLVSGYTEAEGVAKAIAAFLSDLTYAKNTISYMHLGSTILSVASIADIRNMTLNGVSGDLSLLDEEIPMLSNLNVTVIR